MANSDQSTEIERLAVWLGSLAHPSGAHLDAARLLREQAAELVEEKANNGAYAARLERAENEIARLRSEADAATRRRWADDMERLRAMPAEADRRMSAAALLAHAERMLEEADSFGREQGADLRECAAAFRRVAAWMGTRDAG